MAAIGTCLAEGCGENVGEKTKYCRSCSTPEARKKNAEANKVIDAENRAKGYNLPARRVV